MSYHRLIPLYQLDLADLLQVDANYAGLSDAELYNLTPGTYDPDFLRKTLARGEYLYCTDTPALQLVFFDQGNYYINPAAEISAGEDVVQALKKRFSALKHDKPAPYQIIGSMTSSGIRTSYYPPRTGPVAPVNYTPDPTPANTTPIEKTVKDWLTIRFYRFSADREREYLANVPYSINNKYQPANKNIFEQGNSPADGTLHYDDMPYDDFYTVHYGLPGGDQYTAEKLVCVRRVNELEVVQHYIEIVAQYDDPWQTYCTHVPTKATISGSVIFDGPKTKGLQTVFGDGLLASDPSTKRNILGAHRQDGVPAGDAIVELVGDPNVDLKKHEDRIQTTLREMQGELRETVKPWADEWNKDSDWSRKAALLYDARNKGLELGATAWKNDQVDMFEMLGDFFSAAWDGASDAANHFEEWYKQLSTIEQIIWPAMLAKAGVDVLEAELKELWKKRDQILALFKAFAEGSIDAIRNSNRCLNWHER